MLYLLFPLRTLLFKSFIRFLSGNGRVLVPCSEVHCRVESLANPQRLRATSPYTACSHQHSQSWEGRGYFTWLLYDTTTTTIIIPTMITVAALLLIGRDAACNLRMGRRNAGAVVDVTGRSLPLPQDAVSQRLTPLKLKHREQG